MRLRYRVEEWPVAGVFRISRGAVSAVDAVVVELEEDDVVGRGEGAPEGHVVESVDASLAELERVRPRVESGIDRELLLATMSPGAARNALDCALWDLEAKRSGKPAWKSAGLESLGEVITAYTISLDTPAAMAAHAARALERPLLKIKLGDEGVVERIRAVRETAPESRLIVDANEAWTFGQLAAFAPELAASGVELIEQPLPAGDDAELESYSSPVPLCADESCHHRGSLDEVFGRYQLVNIKLDKTGGLTEALLLAKEARSRGLDLMVGCMLGTSLAMAPATLVAQMCNFVDLDGPLLLAEDRQPGITYVGGRLLPAPPELWG